MFGYSQEELYDCFLQYPQNSHISLSKIMQFIVYSSLPLLSENEKIQMDTLKKQYDDLMKDLAESLEDKKKTAQACIDTLYEAVSLYNQSFDRIANYYFESVCN